MTDMTLTEALAEVKRLTDRWGPWHESHFPPGMKAFAAVGNAAASGDLIPRAEAAMAVALVVERAAQIVVANAKKRAIYRNDYAEIRALAPADALAEVQALRTDLADRDRQIVDANILATERLRERIASEAQVQALTADIATLRECAKEEMERAEAAEARLAEVEEELDDWKEAIDNTVPFYIESIGNFTARAEAAEAKLAALVEAATTARMSLYGFAREGDRSGDALNGLDAALAAAKGGEG